MPLVTGPFEVKVSPQPPDNPISEAAKIGRMTLDKQFHGALEAISKGEMLGVMSEVKGSGGYVAMERVTGTLNGHEGSFVLQHNGSMNRGQQHMNITVVPDSASGDLAGLTGTMNIRVEAGKHYYDFEYEIRP